MLEKSSGVGRKPISKATILRALVFKNLRSTASLSVLSAELYERLVLASILSFAPGDKPVHVERFSSYLKNVDNSLLHKVRVSLVEKLIELKIVKCKYLSVDSCPIKANVKENNLKTSVRSRFVKGITSTANLCTISYITVLAVAYFSSFVKEPNKIAL